MTADDIARHIAERYEAEAVAFINERAPRLAYAKYSTGQYGRIMLPLLRRFYPRLDWNGQSTHVAIAITTQLESRGYGYKWEDGTVYFAQKVAA